MQEQTNQPKKPSESEVAELPKPACSPPCEKCQMPGCCRSCDHIHRVELSQSAVMANPDDWRIKMYAPYDQVEFTCLMNDTKRERCKLGSPAFIHNGAPCSDWRLKVLTVQEKNTIWL